MKDFLFVLCSMLPAGLFGADSAPAAKAEDPKVFAPAPDQNSVKISAEEAKAPAAAPEKTPSFFKSWTIGGLAEFAYTYNFNQPKNPADPVFGPDDLKENNLRVFDVEHSEFNLHSVFLDVSKAATDDSWVGFRAVAMAGQDAKFIHSAGLFEDQDFDLVDAYMTVKVPDRVLPFSTIFKLGKWETHHGAEVIPGGLLPGGGSQNLNYSRSYLFGYAIPFTHTGILMDTTWVQRPEEKGELFGTGLGVVNGWDNVKDNNEAKSLMGQVRFQPCDAFETHAELMGGPEQEDNNSNWRGLFDLNGTVKFPGIFEGLSVSGNYDYGWEEDVTAIGYSTWYGFAGYVKYRLAKCRFLKNWSIGLRGEWFNDHDGSRTGVADGASFTGITTTLGYTPWENLLIRLEYRYDKASGDVFEDKADTMTNRQNTIAVNLVVWY